MRVMQMGDFSRPLASEQDHLQWRAEMWPEDGGLGVAQYALATRCVVPLHAGARVCSDDLLPHGPAENHTSGGEHLVRQDGRRDSRDGGLDVCPLDAADVHLGPPWQQV